jgi:hypothetical protein
MVSDPSDLGTRVLVALERGRRAAIAKSRKRAAQLERAVREELDRDILSGKPARGRAGRIERRLQGVVTERHVRRILDSLACASPTDGSRDLRSTQV